MKRRKLKSEYQNIRLYDEISYRKHIHIKYDNPEHDNIVHVDEFSLTLNANLT